MPIKQLSYVNYNGDTYNIDAVTVNGHTVQSDVPSGYSWDKSKVIFSNTLESGHKIADVSVDGTDVPLFAPAYTGTAPITISNMVVSHNNSGVTANTYGTLATAALTPTFGSNFKVPAFTVDAKGHVTAAGEHTVTIPSISVTNDVASGTKLATLSIGGTDEAIYMKDYSVETNGALTLSNFQIAHKTSGPNTTANTSKGESANKTLNYNDTFKVLAATVDKYGHTTALAERTMTLPSKPILSNTPSYDNSSSNFLIDVVTLDGTDYPIYIPKYPTLDSLGLSQALRFIGIAADGVNIQDGSTTDPGITGYTTKKVGDVIIDHESHKEFVWTNSNKWELLGGDGDYALKNTEYDVTNGGTNGKSAVTIKATTTDVYSMTSAGSVTEGQEATLTMNVADEKLSFSFNTNIPTYVTLPGRSNVIKAWTGYTTGVNNTFAAAQTFTPTQKTITL